MNAGLRKKLKGLMWKKTPEQGLVTASTPEPEPGWFYPQSAVELLATPLRQQLMNIIRQRTSMPPELFEELYLAPVARFAELVQQLPASEYHHHAYPGGLLDHSLEVMAFAAKLRQRHLLPVGAAPEDQAREAEAWTAGILYAALLHDAGKIVADIEVVADDNQPWYPWLGSPDKPYRLKYRQNRDYQLHPVAGCLLISRILPDKALSWLAGFPELYATFLYCISGHGERGGVIAEVVQDADRASVAQFMGASASSVLEQAPPSLAKQMLTALRDLVRSRYKLNNPNGGSDGWLTSDALWLVSKTTADNIRAWLLQQGVTGVPDNNIRLFDEMQSYGLIIPTPEDKAVWSCDIHANSGWSPGRSLTLLRLSPSLIWPDVAACPELFDGQVGPVQVSVLVQQALSKGADGAGSGSLPDSDLLGELALSLFSPADVASASEKYSTSVLQEERGEEYTISVPEAVSGYQECLQEEVECDDKEKRRSLSGEAFIEWLRQGVQTRKILVNGRMARVHMVEGHVFLVSPEIFKLYMQATVGSVCEEWRAVQKAFQKLALHRRGNNGVNIMTCQIRGPRNTRMVKGYLLAEPACIFDEAIPEDNPYLSAVNL